MAVVQLELFTFPIFPYLVEYGGNRLIINAESEVEVESLLKEAAPYPNFKTNTEGKFVFNYPGGIESPVTITKLNMDKKGLLEFNYF